MVQLQAYRNAIERNKGARENLVQAHAIYVEELAGLKTDREHIEKARAIIQDVSQLTQQELEFRVSDLVTHALAAVFTDPYQFTLEFTVRREKTEADLIWERADREYLPTSGGVRDVSSLGMRIAFWSLRPKGQRSRPTLILDEPFKHLKPAALQRRAGRVLKGICQSLGLQVIMVTSAESDNTTEVLEYAETAHQVQIEKGVTHAEQIKRPAGGGDASHTGQEQPQLDGPDKARPAKGTRQSSGDHAGHKPRGPRNQPRLQRVQSRRPTRKRGNNK